MAYGTQTPWATGQTSTTDQLAQQLQPDQMTQSGNPLYKGAYNPMFHAANDQKITLKDLASLYYKSQGQGVVGDAPHPFAAARQYGKVGDLTPSPLPGILSNFGGSGMTNPVQSPEAVQKMLQSQIDLAGGNKQAVFDQLVGKVQGRQVQDTAKKAGVSTADAQALQGQAPDAAGGGGNEQDAIASQWMQDYVSPYIQQQQAMQQYQADMFDNVAASIIPTMDPNKAEIMKAYLPLISQAYHQQANNFANNFLTGNGSGSLIANLLANQKRNAAATKFLSGQAGADGGTSSFVQSLIKGI